MDKTKKQQTAAYLQKELKKLQKLKRTPSLLIREAWRISCHALTKVFPEESAMKKNENKEFLMQLELEGYLPTSLRVDLNNLRYLRNMAEHEDFEPEPYQSQYGLVIVKELLKSFSESGSGLIITQIQQKRKSTLGIYRQLMEYISSSPGECDDCIADGTGIKPRQRVRYFLLRMAEEDFIERFNDLFCIGCDNKKIISMPLDLPK